MDENVCRICLQVSEEEEMSSIYDSDENNTIISDKIQSCCGVELPIESDGFPTKICSKCKIFLTIAYKLRTICQNSDAYLRRFKAKDSEAEETEEMILKRETEVTTWEDNIDNKSISSQRSVPDMEEEETRDEFHMRLYNSNGSIETKIQIERVTSEEKLNAEFINEIDTKTFEEKITSKPIQPKRSLKKHKKQPVTKPKKKKCGVCPYCGDMYAISSLSLHIRRHTGEKPYKCDVCEKAFVELYDLKRHKRMHTGEKPHVCATCGKAFSQQNKLSRHNLVHTGERPYKCEHCGKSFTQKNELNIHIRRHTGSKPYMCGICGECFLTGTILRNHQKSKSHFEEDKHDRFIKIRVTNPTRSYRNRGGKSSQQPSV